MNLSFEQWLQYIALMLRGSVTTVELTVACCLLGFVLALGAGLARLSHSAALRWAATIYVEFFRSTSLYVQLFFAYFVLPLMGIGLTAMEAGILALSLNGGAYGSEIVRAAVQDVPRNQREACIAVNLTRWQAMRHVILPQALLVMIPSLSNLAIELLKATAVVSLISISDLTFHAQTVRVQTGNTAIPFLTSLTIYFVIASVINFLFTTLERRLGRGRETVRT